MDNTTKIMNNKCYSLLKMPTNIALGTDELEQTQHFSSVCNEEYPMLNILRNSRPLSIFVSTQLTISLFCQISVLHSVIYNNACVHTVCIIVPLALIALVQRSKAARVLQLFSSHFQLLQWHSCGGVMRRCVQIHFSK